MAICLKKSKLFLQAYFTAIRDHQKMIFDQSTFNRFYSLMNNSNKQTIEEAGSYTQCEYYYINILMSLDDLQSLQHNIDQLSKSLTELDPEAKYYININALKEKLYDVWVPELSMNSTGDERWNFSSHCLNAKE